MHDLRTAPPAAHPTTDTPEWFAPGRDRAWRCAPPQADATEFHRSLPGYVPSPIVELPAIASDLGLGRLIAKDESNRLGLPAFKALGASWAVHQAVRDRRCSEPLTLVAATDGNHGRAVAHFARRAGHRAVVFVPDGVHPGAITAIREEGADVRVVEADYDTAVSVAAEYAAEIGGELIQDTAWPGYTAVPQTIVDGYETLFAELDEQLADPPDLVIVPTGVGSLLQAALRHYRSSSSTGSTMVASVEPTTAACVSRSLRAGRPVTVSTGHTAMAGLNCGTVSTLAWPYIVGGLDIAFTVSDDASRLAASALAAAGLPGGPCGAASLAALLLARQADAAVDALSHLGLGAHSTVVLLMTEGNDANPYSMSGG